MLMNNKVMIIRVISALVLVVILIKVAAYGLFYTSIGNYYVTPVKPDKKVSIINENNYVNQSIAKDTPDYVWEALPDKAPEPDDNPLTIAKVALGKKLFFEKNLSFDASISCASCHEISQRKGGADGRRTSLGIYNLRGSRNAPTVLNAAFQRVLFWDGRANSLEEQAKGPILNPLEMRMPSFDEVKRRLKKLPEYPLLFENAFGVKNAITEGNIVKAIASFERTLITPNSPYDRFVKGDTTALTKQQVRGMALFESTGCILCHSGPNFSDASMGPSKSAFRLFPALIDISYESKYGFTKDKGREKSEGSGTGVWRIPSLRNVSLTAPYFHNGSVDDLKEAIRIMATVQLNKVVKKTANDEKRYYWSPNDKKFHVEDDISLSESDIDDLASFLESLTSQIDILPTIINQDEK